MELRRMQSRCWKVVRTQADWQGEGEGEDQDDSQLPGLSN